MAEYQPKKRETEDKTLRRKKARDSSQEKVKAQDDTKEPKRTGVPFLEDHASLLSDIRLSQPANAGQMADIVSGLQRDYGNAYVQRLLRSKSIQAKLTVSPPDDQHEKEADRAAEIVAKAPQFQSQRQEAEEEEELLATKLEVQRQDAEEETEVRVKADDARTPEVPQELEARIDSARCGGEPLPDTVRASVEPQFGRDFSDVKIHADTEADSLSQQLRARAFTTGHDVFFREEAYQPETEGGRQLIGHELTHVVQQGAAPVFRKPAETEEKEAADTKELVIPQLKKARDKAVSDMTKANMKELFLHAAHCQQIGAAESAKDALDLVATQALASLKGKANTPNVETSSRKIVKDLLDQLEKMPLFSENSKGKSADATLDKLLKLVQTQLVGTIKLLQSAPGESTAKDVIEKGAMALMLGGDTIAAVSALQTWAETERT